MLLADSLPVIIDFLFISGSREATTRHYWCNFKGIGLNKALSCSLHSYNCNFALLIVADSKITVLEYYFFI